MMDMELVVPLVPPPPSSTAVDFNFDSNCSSPYITAPSSPQRFGTFFFSAPTSPTRISSFLHQLDLSSSSSSSSVPFHPKFNNNDADDTFEFNFSGHLQPPSLSAADELFDGGKIRPLKPPPRLQSVHGVTSPASSPRSRISQGIKALSPKKRDHDFDPFAAALEETRRREEEKEEEEEEEEEEEKQKQRRGRHRASATQSFAGRKGSRSLSPLRVSDIVCDSEDKGDVLSSASNNNTKTSYASSFLSSIPFTRGYRKWRLKDFLLFRSASEGRATDKDPLMMRNKYEDSVHVHAHDGRNSGSFRSSEGSCSGSVSKRRGSVSAHELHYTVNRAASEELKKRTFLPYKRGLLGCLGFNPGGSTSMRHISRGIASFTPS